MSESLCLGLYRWDFHARTSADEAQKPLDAFDISRCRVYGGTQLTFTLTRLGGKKVTRTCAASPNLPVLCDPKTLRGASVCLQLGHDVLTERRRHLRHSPPTRAIQGAASGPAPSAGG